MILRQENLGGPEFHGVRELAEEAERYIRAHGTIQEKGTVSEYPNERTVRYYLSEGLLEPPIDKRGVASVFGYNHLLSLVLIKKLQSEGLPINVIKLLIKDKSNEELEKLISEEVRLFTSVEDLETYRETHGHTDDSDVKVLKGSGGDLRLDPFGQHGSRATNYLNSLRSERGREDEPHPSKMMPPLFSRPNEDPGDPDGEPLFSVSRLPAEEWRRHEILPGLELHVSSRFRTPKSTDLKKRLFLLIEKILESGRRSDKE